MKMTMILMALALIGTAGCASLQQAYQNQYCNENGGFEKGMNDARSDLPMNSNFFGSCTPESQTSAQNGYRSGYAQGLAARASETPGTQINVNLGNGSVSDGGSYGHTYYCEIHAFTETFAAWGATELEAQVDAKAKCTRQYHEMHCGQISCRH